MSHGCHVTLAYAINLLGHFACMCGIHTHTYIYIISKNFLHYIYHIRLYILHLSLSQIESIRLPD